MSEQTPVSLTLDQAKEAIDDIVERLKSEEVADVIEAAKEEADGDLDKIMELIVPKFFEVQGHVMLKFGFEPTDEGFGDFAESLRKHESDEDFAAKSAVMKQIMKDATEIKGTQVTA